MQNSNRIQSRSELRGDSRAIYLLTEFLKKFLCPITFVTIFHYTMATEPKQSRKSTKRKNTEAAPSKEANPDLDYNADELEVPSSPNHADSAQIIQEMRSTILGLRQSNVEVSEKLNEFRMRIDLGDIDEYQWKKVGLHKQYTVSNSILQCFESARSHIISGNKEKGLSSMDNGLKLLNHRMRCLKIADSSPAGWETVNEYVSSPLSIDDEDDKRLKRAEKIATERMKERTDSRRGRGRFNFRSRGGSQFNQIRQASRIQGEGGFLQVFR